MTYHGDSRSLLNNFNIIAYLFQKKKIMLPWSQNELRIKKVFRMGYFSWNCGYVCYSCGYWLLFKENSLLGDGNDNVAGYNSWTSGMKPVFRLFCVPVIVSQIKTRGS